MTDPRWVLLQEMEPALLRAFAAAGVVRIEYVAAFPDLEGAWVWLGTTSDAERDVLAAREREALGQVRCIADAHGFPADHISGIAAQSEETVERDYAGSWFYALR